MKIQQQPPSFYERINRINLLDTAESQTTLKNMNDEQKHLFMTDAVNVKISDEGLDALRERVNELQPEIDYDDFGEAHPVETNEIEFGYYMAMRQMMGLTLEKRENYDAEDVMKSIMEAYETLYNQIVEEHKYGDRQVSCKIMGDVTLTLEEDLAKLDEAFERNVGDIEGLVTRTQTRSITWLEHRSSIQTIQSGKEYCDMAFSMMRLARENFLALCDDKNNQKGAAKGIISDIINENDVFMEMTKELFSNINTRKS